MKMNGGWSVALALAAGSVLPAAEADLFYIDPALSTVTWSGSATLADVEGTYSGNVLGVSVSGAFAVSGSGTLVEQGAGSLATPLAGTVDATETGGTLTFNGSAISANDNGTWKPDGSNDAASTALAQLAGQVTPSVELAFSEGLLDALAYFIIPYLESQLERTTYGAARSLDLDVTGSSVLGVGGSFSSSTLTGDWASGIINVGGGVSGAWFLTGLSGLLGSSTGTFVDAVVDELILPFDLAFTQVFSLAGIGGDFGGDFGGMSVGGSATITGGTLEISTRYVGRIVATTQPPDGSVPEPATMALLGIGLAALGALRRRRPN